MAKLSTYYSYISYRIPNILFSWMMSDVALPFVALPIPSHPRHFYIGRYIHLNCKSNSYPTPHPTLTPSLNRSICNLPPPRHLRIFPTRTLRYDIKRRWLKLKICTFRTAVVFFGADRRIFLSGNVINVCRIFLSSHSAQLTTHNYS